MGHSSGRCRSRIDDASTPARVPTVTAVDANVDDRLLPTPVDLTRISHTEWERDGADSDVVVWNNNIVFPAGAMDRTRCSLFVNWGTNTTNIESPDEIRAVARLATTQGYCTDTVATWMLTTAEAHRPIRSAVVGVIGLGRIGYRVAQLAADRGAGVLCWTPTPRRGVPFPAVELNELLAVSEIIFVAVNTRTPLDFRGLTANRFAPVMVNVSPDSVCPPDQVAPLVGVLVSDNKAPTGTAWPGVYTGKVAYKSPAATAHKHTLLARAIATTAGLGSPAVVLVARHGRTHWNDTGRRQGRLDSPLTPAGIAQADELAEVCTTAGVTRIYSSPLGRATATATRISTALDVPVEVCDELVEMDFGVFQGEPDSLIERLPTYRAMRRLDPLYTRYPDGESYYDLYLRVHPTVDRIVATGDSSIIVGHSSLNRMIRAALTNQAPGELATVRQPNNHVLAINPTTATTTALTLTGTHS